MAPTPSTGGSRRAGFIGAGTVAHLHAKGIAVTPGVSLAGVYAPDEGRTRAFAETYGARAYDSLDALVADPAIDVIHVLSPHAHHVDQAIACLEAGKHVIVEKPVAATAAEIARLKDAAAAAGRICAPCHNYIHAPSLIRARRMVEEGRLGTIGSLWILYNVFHPEEVAAIYGGVLRAVCVHHAYSMLYLLGRPARLTATAASLHYERLECEDQVMIVCDMPDGAIANLWASFLSDDPTSDPWTVTYKLLGTNGGVSYTWNDASVQDDGGPAWGLVNYVDSFRHLIDDFYNRCVAGGEAPLSTLDDAIDALAIVEAAERSIAEGGKVDIAYR